MSESRLYPTRPFLAASVAVVQDDRVLLAARGRPPLALVWSLPGGLVEPGETLAEGALRELKEETGVEARILAFIRPIEFIEHDGDGHAKHHFVICAHVARWVSGEGETSVEAPAIRWARREEIADRPTTPGLVPVLEAAFDIAAGAAR